jgi:hypothetical protein
MRFVQWVSGFGLVLGLVGCGAATSEITAELNRFQCVSEDFARIDTAVSKLLKNGADFVSAESYAYEQFEAFNAKLASKCGVTVLQECSPSASKVARGNAIVGPINALGVYGTVEIRMVPHHDGLYRGSKPELHCRSSVNVKKFRAGIACFSQAAR